MSGTLKQRAYSHVYKKLFNGELAPGDRLSGRALAKEIGISPIPVRDAINQLRNEGFIETRQGGGTYVPEPSYEELMDLYDQREALECHAMAQAVASIDEIELAKLQQCLDMMSSAIESLDMNTAPIDRDSAVLERWVKADATFHDTLMQAAGNQRSLKAIVNLRVMTRIFGKQVRHKPYQSFQRVHKEHIKIFEAVRSGNVEEARSAMADHIRNGCRSILEAHRRKRVKLTGDFPNIEEASAG